MEGFATLSGTVKRGQLGRPPPPKDSQTVRQLPTKHRTPTSILPNRRRRADQAKRGGLVRGGVFWEGSIVARCGRRTR